MKNLFLFATILLTLGNAAEAQQWTTSGTNIYNSNTGNVGIGTTTPGSLLEIRNGKLALYAPGGVPGIGNHSFLVGSTTSAVQLGIGTDGYNTSWLQSYQADNGLLKPLILNPLGGNIGIGITNPQSSFHMVGAGMSKDASSQNNGNLIIQASTGGRSATLGAQLEFVIPAGTDGTNFWGQGRIITVAGNSNTNDATGKMIIGTRRSYNKMGTGTLWYYGDDITIDGGGKVGIGTLNPVAQLDINGPTRSQAYISNVSNMNDQFTHNGLSFNHYGITWVNDSWQSGGSTAWFSGWGGVKLFTGGQNRLNINLSGNVGIGTATPQSLLHVVGDITAGQGAAQGTAIAGRLLISDGTNGTASINGNHTDNNNVGIDFTVLNASTALDAVSIKPTGNMVIGQPTAGNPYNANYLLDVKGFARANKLVVNTNGADFVFEPTYKLTPLNKVEEFIKANHHLSGIEPAAQMQKDGVDVGDNTTALLRKVEELTLYAIAQDKKIESQQKLLEELTKRIHALEANK